MYITKARFIYLVIPFLTLISYILIYVLLGNIPISTAWFGMLMNHPYGYMLCFGSFLWTIGSTYFIILFLQYQKFDRIISELQTQQSYTVGYIYDIFTTELWGRNTGNMWYQYICKDMSDDTATYLSDFTRNNAIELGSKVHIYHNNINYPDIWWVDLDSIQKWDQATLKMPEIQNNRDKQIYQEEKMTKQDEAFAKNLFLIMFVIGLIFWFIGYIIRHH
jgi:hypothetical protein